jgi:hypothetical protein
VIRRVAIGAHAMADYANANPPYAPYRKTSHPSGSKMHSVKTNPSISLPNFSTDEICEGSRLGWRSSQ